MRANILDCTFIDGGYYKRWNFSQGTVSEYLDCIGKSGVTHVEIGLRLPPKKGSFLGAHAYCTEEYLATLSLCPGIQYGVMINAKDFLMAKIDTSLLEKSFVPKSASRISFVRVAAHYGEIDDSRAICHYLKSLGYHVCLNLMQTGGKSLEEVAQAAEKLSNWTEVDVVYIADSLGCMDDKDVKNTVSAMRKYWKGDIGIHAHDNCFRALSNSLAALEHGATWIDGTILGMGRGPGNTQVENLLTELAERGENTYQPAALYPLLTGSFRDLKKEFGWGGDAFYHLAAKRRIHPTFIQTILQADSYPPQQVSAVMDVLSKENSTSFDKGKLEGALFEYSGKSQGKWNPAGFATNENLLLLGGGNSLNLHQAAVLRFIDRESCRVISLNRNISFPEEKVDLYVAAHKLRVIAEAPALQALKKPLVCPLGDLPLSLTEVLDNIEILDFGMKVTENEFQVLKTSCIVPTALTLGYALAIAKASGAKKIFIAGFDGYPNSWKMHNEVNTLFRLFLGQQERPEVLSITPSTYDSIQCLSVYAPTVT